MIDSLLKILSTIAIATISSLITVHLSKKKFRTERWWEKKVEAYERVIEALHNFKKFDSGHLDADLSGIEITDERKFELMKSAKLAIDEIRRSADAGAFILSEKAIEILTSFEKESREAAENSQSWYEQADTSLEITNRYMLEFIAEAKVDLKK
ncbi:MAG: hypothetical protein V3W18_05530 [candidate division Zixibacteria bacterium]